MFLILGVGFFCLFSYMLGAIFVLNIYLFFEGELRIVCGREGGDLKGLA